jgi:hypothetical protein
MIRGPLPIRSLLLAAIALTLSCFAQTETVIYNFQGTADGSNPQSSPIADAQGNLYVTASTALGCCGTVIQLKPPSVSGGNWTETTIYTFVGPPNDGYWPRAGLVADASGNLYGTTVYGGTGNCNLGGPLLGCGTVFRLSPPATAGGVWTESVLYSFKGGTADGRFPFAGVVFDAQGNLYGTTTSGGNGFCYGFPGDCGTAFKLSPAAMTGRPWRERILHNFGNGGDGQHPAAPLVVDPSGVLYGTTETGGVNDCSPDFGANLFCGTVFQLTPPSAPNLKWDERSFNFGVTVQQGFFPAAGLVEGKNGKLYGVTANGPATTTASCTDDLGFGQGCGVIFEITPPFLNSGHWGFAHLYDFANLGDGAVPLATLTVDRKGNLYGTANGGGGLGTCGGVAFAPEVVSVNGCGTVFELSPPNTKGGSWTDTTLHQFSGGTDGARPTGGLIPDGKGGFFGTTWIGGTGTGCDGLYGCGTVFEITP